VLGSYCSTKAPFKEQWLRWWSKPIRYVYSTFNFDSFEPYFISSNAFWRKILTQKEAFALRSGEHALLLRNRKLDLSISVKLCDS
jgi:hypothetical protein